jgi:hypothetical protein
MAEILECEDEILRRDARFVEVSPAGVKVEKRSPALGFAL